MSADTPSTPIRRRRPPSDSAHNSPMPQKTKVAGLGGGKRTPTIPPLLLIGAGALGGALLTGALLAGRELLLPARGDSLDVSTSGRPTYLLIGACGKGERRGAR